MASNVRFYRGSGMPTSVDSNGLYFTQEGVLYDGSSNRFIGGNVGSGNVLKQKGFYYGTIYDGDLHGHTGGLGDNAEGIATSSLAVTLLLTSQSISYVDFYPFWTDPKYDTYNATTYPYTFDLAKDNFSSVQSVDINGASSASRVALVANSKIYSDVCLSGMHYEIVVNSCHNISLDCGDPDTEDSYDYKQVETAAIELGKREYGTTNCSPLTWAEFYKCFHGTPPSWSDSKDIDTFSIYFPDLPDVGSHVIKEQQSSIGSLNRGSGSYSVTLGAGNITYGDYAIAGGNSNIANWSCIALGRKNYAWGQHSVSIGMHNETLRRSSVGIGAENTVFGDHAVALGNNNGVRSNNGVAIGSGNTVTGVGSVLVGHANSTSGQRNTLLGSNLQTSNNDVVVVGMHNSDKKWYRFSVGDGSATTKLTAFGVRASEADFNTPVNLNKGGKLTGTLSGGTYAGTISTTNSARFSGSSNVVISNTELIGSMKNSLVVGDDTNKTTGGMHNSSLIIGARNHFKGVKESSDTEDINTGDSTNRLLYCAAIGTDNKITKTKCITIGYGLQTSNTYQVVLGTYNSPATDFDSVSLVVGNGTSSNTPNSALIVGRDGGASKIFINGNFETNQLGNYSTNLQNRVYAPRMYFVEGTYTFDDNLWTYLTSIDSMFATHFSKSLTIKGIMSLYDAYTGYHSIHSGVSTYDNGILAKTSVGTTFLIKVTKTNLGSDGRTADIQFSSTELGLPVYIIDIYEDPDICNVFQGPNAQLGSPYVTIRFVKSRNGTYTQVVGTEINGDYYTGIPTALMYNLTTCYPAICNMIF